MSDRAPVRSYRTEFDHGETPISEGGAWRNGKADGIDWSDVEITGGVAHGAPSRMDVEERRAEQGNLDGDEAAIGDYDDPTAVLAGEWGPDQHAKGIVFSRNPTSEYFQEVQLRLRSTIEPHSCTGYEIFWRCLRSEEAYAEIVRWNGPVGDFTSLARKTGADFGVKHGDAVEATIEGDVIKGIVNGSEVISATDDAFASGAPGVGFNFGVGDTNVDHGFSSLEVDTFDA
jgi:hypothetical protein